MTATTPADGGALLKLGTFLRKGTASDDLRQIYLQGGREGDAFYRDRWSHDKVVRSTHGVNCTGSCSWKVYVKDGIITWEAQQTDYPSTGPNMPEYEPRGCPRGAAFSWYTYSPTRVRYPYMRAVLVNLWREAREQHADPVDAWESIVEDPDKARSYKQQRGRGGLVRVGWDEVEELMAAAHVYTTKAYGPDRLAGFSVIPAMSQVSYGAGTRFYSLMGGTILSFYDWYADLPMASPQVFGDQTDVPESGDWYNSSYIMMWGSNVPVTRTPDAHFMTEVRYKGAKVVVVSPDFADNTKFADEWMPISPGTDGALGMAMGHVVLRDFHVARREKYFFDYMKKHTDAPMLVELEAREDIPGGDGTAGAPAYTAGKFVTAADLAAHESTAALPSVIANEANAEFKTVVMDANGTPVVPNGSLGHRYGEADLGKWNLTLDDVDPQMSVADIAVARGGSTVAGTEGAADIADAAGGSAVRTVELLLPRFDALPTPGDEDQAHLGSSEILRRGVPVREVAGRLVTTVYDLMLAQYGVERPELDLPGQWPKDEHDADAPGTPAWAATLCGVSPASITRVAREFAQNAVDSQGRSMIIMGAGTNHYFHSDTIYRTMLSLIMMTGCQGKNGGGWAHYVGQEKVRPITGWQQYAMALDWQRPTRQMTTASYWYLATDQWRYDGLPVDALASPLASDAMRGRTTADTLIEANKRGWMPSYPTFDRNPLTLGAEAKAAGTDVKEYVVDQLRSGQLGWASTDPDNPANFPRVVVNWRTNLLGSSAKGAEYFHKHLLGSGHSLRAAEAPEHRRPKSIVWREEGAEGKTDLFATIDFRMTSTTLHSDIVLPAATWYEKHDISSTDMHPFLHSFNAAIPPPWETRTDYSIFQTLARRVSLLAHGHLDTRTDVLAAPLNHDTPDAMALPHGHVPPLDETPLIPGKTMPKLIAIERDYTKIGEKFDSLGPLTAKLGLQVKGITYRAEEEIEYLKDLNGRTRGGLADGQPLLDTDIKAANMILAMSGTSNGRLATQGFRELEKRTGTDMHHLAAEAEGRRTTFEDTQIAPVSVVTSPEWSGSETGGRRYTAFAQNVDHDKPWHTLTGRMHFYLDHDWMMDLGEQLPIFKPPLDMHRLFGDAELTGKATNAGAGTAVPQRESNGELEVAVRYLTPHNKWSIHSEYNDNLYMLALSRGGPSLWMSVQDAEKIGVKDNEWVESYNRNGVVVARSVVSHRMPEGTVFLHHATERTVDIPRAETSGRRGGIHNALTRVLMKPTHLAGGYAQHAYAFNYVGPTGNQRDEVTVVRRRSQEVQY